MLRDTHPTVDVGEFAGLDNVNQPYEVPLGRLKEAKNVDITRAGKVRRRAGQTQVSPTAYTAVSCPDDRVVLALDSIGDVHFLDDSFNVEDTFEALNNYPPYDKLVSKRVLGKVVFSNGRGIGLCDASTGEELTFDAINTANDRQFDHSHPPAFIDIELFNGRMYYATLNYVYYSPVFGYFRVRKGKDYYRFDDYVTMVAQVEGGLFVSTLSETFFLQGGDAKRVTKTQVSDDGAIEGTKTYVHGSVVGSGESTEMLPMWATASGFCVGLPGGQVNRITQKYVNLPSGSLGSTVFRNENGQNHIVSVIQS